MNEGILTHRDRMDLRAVLFREIGYVGVSSAAGKRAKELLAKLDAMDSGNQPAQLKLPQLAQGGLQEVTPGELARQREIAAIMNPSLGSYHV